MERITQNEIGKIYKQRLESPELYAGEPVVVWRSYFEDGLLFPELREINRFFNEDRKEGEKEYFGIKGFQLEQLKDKNDKVSIYSEKYKACVFYLDIVESEFQGPHTFDSDMATLVSEWLNGITSTLKVPMILHLPFIEIPESLYGHEMTQCVFQPDFEEWKRSELKCNDIFVNLLFGFLESIKSSRDNDYSWYWYFHKSPDYPNVEGFQNACESTGCNFPSCWMNGLSTLKRNLYLPMTQISPNYKPREDRFISKIPMEKFKLFFDKGISDDLIEAFRNYLIGHHDRWEDPLKVKR